VAAAQVARCSGHERQASRSIEEIKLVFEKNKGAIYSMYTRALRDEPSLQARSCSS